MVPVFTENRLTGLASSSAPAASPRLRRSPSPWPSHRHRKPATKSTALKRSCAAPRPISARFEPVTRLRSFTTGSSRIPSDLARRTRPVWPYQTVPALSALLPALPGVSRIRLRPAPAGLLRQPREEVLHLLRFPAPHGALRPRVATTPTGRTGPSASNHPTGRSKHHPPTTTPASADATGSAASSTSIPRPHEVTALSAPTRSCGLTGGCHRTVIVLPRIQADARPGLGPITAGSMRDARFEDHGTGSGRIGDCRLCRTRASACPAG